MTNEINLDSIKEDILAIRVMFDKYQIELEAVDARDPSGYQFPDSAKLEDAIEELETLNWFATSFVGCFYAFLIAARNECERRIHEKRILAGQAWLQ